MAEENLTIHGQRAASESHWYEVGIGDALKVVGWTLAPALGLGLLLGILLRGPFLPGPAYLSDPDTAILGAKSALAKAGGKAEWVAVGDSSCLMNVDTQVVDAGAGGRLLNLGALSFLGLDSFGKLASEGLKTGDSGKVVVVMHPEALRMVKTSDVHREILDAAFAGRTPPRLSTNNPIAELLGYNELRWRGCDRWMPTVLPLGLGGRYGFTETLREEVLRRAGSLDEPGVFNAATNRVSAEYRFAPRIERECGAFRKQLPAGTKVQLVISPVPRSHALRAHEATVREMRNQLGEWLGAEADWGLPVILDDGEFGTVTHLRPDGARRYSAILAERLKAWR